MPSWRFYTGQSREEIWGWGWLNAVNPEDREMTAQAWTNAVASMSPFEFEYRLRRHDGVYRTFFSRAIPVYEGDGTVREWVGFCTDITERKHAEASLKALIDASPLSIVALNLDGTVRSWNHAAERMFGWTEAEVVGRLSPTVPDEEKGASDEVLARIQSGEVVTGLERRRLRKDGSSIDVSFSTAPLYDAEGRLDGTVVLAADISDRKRAEREAEAQRQRLHCLFMEAPAIIAVTRGPEHVFELANPGYLQLVGHRDIIGKPIRQAMPELEAQGYFEIQNHVYATGDPFVGKEMPAWLDRNGNGGLEERFFNFTLQPTRDASGAVDGLMVHAVDVTDQVLARRHSERLAAERAAILGQIAEGIIIADPEGRIVYLNDAGRGILGTQVLGVPLEQHAEAYHVYQLDGSPYPAEQLPLSRAILHRETVLDEQLSIHRQDGSEVIVEASATPVQADDGTQIGSVATFRDVTAQYHLSREKDEFLGAAAHDLKTPLTTIKALAQMLHRRAARGTVRAEQLVDGLARIDGTAVRMTNLINELLDVTRIQMDRPLDLALGPVDLIGLALEVARESQETTDRHRIVVESDLPELPGLWDRDRLDRVISNLLSNAVKYSPNGGDIRVTIGVGRGEASHAVLAVSDRGIGVPTADLPHIFERFHRARNVAHRIPGTGIGLAGARHIVEQHGGSISVESEEGAGTTFTVRLPLDPRNCGAKDLKAANAKRSERDEVE